MITSGLIVDYTECDSMGTNAENNSGSDIQSLRDLGQERIAFAFDFEALTKGLPYEDVTEIMKEWLELSPQLMFFLLKSHI